MLFDKILAGLCAALALALCVILILNANLRAELASAKANATALLAVNDDWKDRAARQNRLIKAIQDDAVRRAKAADVAMRAARKSAARYATQAAALAARKTGGDDCVAARDVLHAYIRSVR